MDIGQKIKSILQEAELYQNQSLHKEARQKYIDASQIIQKIGNLKNKEQILDGIAKKIRAVEDAIERFEKAPKTPEVSQKIQDLIKEKFSFGKEGESKELEGAIALAKFGQFERALREFGELLKNDSLRVVAAKNIIRCHVSLEAVDTAVAQFSEWNSGNLFTEAQIENLRVFFQNILDKKGIQQDLREHKRGPVQPQEADMTEVPHLEMESAELTRDEDDLLDVSSIGLFFESGPQKGKLVEFDVSFQSGNDISLLIHKRDYEMIAHLTPGTRIQEIEFYSPFAMFKGSGTVIARTKINTGPKRGDYSLDIRVIRT